METEKIYFKRIATIVKSFYIHNKKFDSSILDLLYNSNYTIASKYNGKYLVSDLYTEKVK